MELFCNQYFEARKIVEEEVCSNRTVRRVIHEDLYILYSNEKWFDQDNCQNACVYSESLEAAFFIYLLNQTG